MLLEQDTFPERVKSSCQLQPAVPHSSPGTGTIPAQGAAALLAGSSTGTDTQRSNELHRLTNLPWLNVQVGKTESSSIGRDAVGVHLHLPGSAGAQPAPERPPWIIPPSTPVEELAPSGTGIIALQCAALESVIHPLKYSTTANHNTVCLMMENASSFHEMECTAKQRKKPSCT